MFYYKKQIGEEFSYITSSKEPRDLTGLVIITEDEFSAAMETLAQQELEELERKELEDNYGITS